MKKSKLIAMVASLATVATCAISTATVFAADPSVNLVKVDEDTVAVYFANIPTAIWTWDMTIDMENVTKATWTADSAATAVFDTAGSNFANGALKITMASNASELAIASGEGTKMGVIDLQITDAAADVVLTPSVINIQDINEVDYKLSAGSIAAPALTISNAPVKPQLPAYEGELTATPIEGLFDDDTTTVPVKAWMTDAIDWSSYDAVKALNWIITVNGVEQAPVAATQTEVTGGMTVIYGLAIAGRADQLETIESVVLK